MNKGFTLIELLVVVLIIGILAAVALPQYTKAVEKSRAAEAMQVLGDLVTAEQIYYMSTNTFTDNFGLLDLTFPGACTTASGKLETNSFNVSCTADADAFSCDATRKGGTYTDNDDKISISVSKEGVVNRSTGGDFTSLVGTQWHS